MPQPLINRVYNLQVAGYDDAITKVESLTKAFNDMDVIKKKLNTSLQQKLTAGDQDAVTALTKKIKDLETEMAKLKTQRDSAAKEAELLSRAEKNTADALLKTEKATVSVARAEQIRSQTLINQNKELQRQQEIEEKQKAALDREKKAVDALEGSYLKLKSQRLALEKLTDAGNKTSTFSFEGKSLNFDEAISKIKELKSQEQQYLDQKKVEKTSQDQITKSLQETINVIRQEKVELEAIIKTSNEKSTISFKGETFNFDEAINKVHQLEAADAALTRRLDQQGTETKELQGNYYGLLTVQKQALEIYRLTPADSPFFETAKKGAIEAKAKVDAFNRSLSPDGTLVGEYRKGILAAFKDLGLGEVFKKQKDDLTNQLNKLKKESQDLAAEYKKTGAAGKESFERIELQLRDNFEQQEQVKKSLVSLDSALHNTGTVGSQISNGIASGFKNAKLQLSQLLLGYVGFQAAVSGLRSTISLNFDFEDSIAQLKAITGVAGNDLEFLKQQALETSSKTKFSAIEILESFKLIASAKPELLENVDGLNQVKDASVLLAQASGQTLPQAVDSLTKVLNQFNAPADQAAQFIDALAAGAKFGAAEVPAITAALLDFGTQAKSSNVSVQESVGLIELLAEKGIQGAEAGTKLRNVLLVLNASNALDKSAQDSLKAAGVDLNVLSNNSLTLEQRLTELSKVQNNNTALVRIFGKENFNAGQIVLQNVPRYAALASQIKETGIAQEQAADQTNTASVAWAKVKNQIANLLTSDKVTAVLTGLATAVGFIANHAGALVSVIGTLIVSFGLYRAELAIAAFQQGVLSEKTLAYFLLSRLQAAQIFILNGLQSAQNFLLATYTAITIRANAATGVSAVLIRALGVAFRFLTGPIGIVIGLTTALVTILGVMSANANTAARSTQELAKRQAEAAANSRINAEIAERIAKATENQVAKIRQLTAVTTDSNISDSTRKKALDELIKISPKYREALQGEAIDIGKVKSISDDLIASLQKQARAKAVADIAAEKERKVFELETKISTSQVTDKGSAGEFIKGLGHAIGIGSGTTRQQRTELQDELEIAREDLKAIYKQVGENKEIQNAIIDQSNKPLIENAGGSITLESLKNQLSDINNQIASLDRIKSKSEAQLNQLKTLRSQRAEVLKQIRELGGDDKAARGSRISGEVTDKLKDIEATQNEERLKLEKAFLKRDEFERSDHTKVVIANEVTYLNELFKINEAAINKKLAKLSDANASERLKRTELQVELIKDEEQTNKQIFDIKKRELDAELESIKKQSETQLSQVIDDPTKSNQDKLHAKEEFLTQEYVIQFLYNQRIETLEKLYNQRSIENEKKRHEVLTNIDKEFNKNKQELTIGVLKEIEEATDQDIAKIKLKFEKLKQEILNSTKSVKIKGCLSRSL